MLLDSVELLLICGIALLDRWREGLQPVKELVSNGAGGAGDRRRLTKGRFV
jgi:hypothetical protein